MFTNKEKEKEKKNISKSGFNINGRVIRSNNYFIIFSGIISTFIFQSQKYGFIYSPIIVNLKAVI